MDVALTAALGAAWPGLSPARVGRGGGRVRLINVAEPQIAGEPGSRVPAGHTKSHGSQSTSDELRQRRRYPEVSSGLFRSQAGPRGQKGAGAPRRTRIDGSFLRLRAAEGRSRDWKA